jgi:hypothetical protein
MARLGRPPLYNNCMDMEAACELYFETCDEGELIDHVLKTGEVVKLRRPIPYTMTGLALALGFCDRQALWNYKERNEGSENFVDTIKRARARIEEQRSRQLLDGSNPVGKIFDLKNNFGWVDKHEVEANTSISVTIERQ